MKAFLAGIGAAASQLPVVIVVALAMGCAKGGAPAREVVIATATSLRGVEPELAKGFEAMHPGVHVVASFGASGSLAREVSAGAPVDAVIFANGKTVDSLVAEGRIDAPTKRVVATNALVLIGPAGAPPLTFATIDAARPGERIAIGDPRSVPAGQYARETLTRLGKWDAVQGRLVLGGDVAAVLAYVRRGEVAAGVVYRTEVQGVAGVVILDTATGAPPPEVVGAIVTGAKDAEDASAFLEFIASPSGRRTLSAFGFGPP